MTVVDIKLDNGTRRLIITHDISDQWSVPLGSVQFSNYAKCYGNVCRFIIWGNVGLRGSEGSMGSMVGD